MYPREFFDTFWRPDIKDEVFVAMSFDSSLSQAWENIIRPGIEDTGLRPHRVDATRISGSIITEIMDGIAHARVILADLSSVQVSDIDKDKRFPNSNVMYEIGLAHALRQDSEVLLIRGDEAKLLFDVSTIRIHKYYQSDIVGSRKMIFTLINDALNEINITRVTCPLF